MHKWIGWFEPVTKCLFVFSFAIDCVSPVAIASTRTAAFSNITLPFSAATVYDTESLSILPNGDGIVLESHRTIDFETTNSAHATEAAFTLSDNLFADAVRQSGAVAIELYSVPSTSVPKPFSSPLRSEKKTTTNGHTSKPSSTIYSGTTKLPLSSASDSQSTGGLNISTPSSRLVSGTSSAIHSSSSSSNLSFTSTDNTSSSSLRSPLPTSTDSTTAATGSLQGTTSSDIKSSSLHSTTVGAPSITTATVAQSGKTGTSSAINGGSESSRITIPPITSTFASSQATSGVSSVSSQLAGLIPIIKSWKANPTLLKSDTLSKIRPVKSDVEDLISHLGGDSTSSGCHSKRKRGLLGTFADIVKSLSCVDEDLNSITDNINADDINAIDGSLDNLTSENNDLTDNHNKPSSNSNPDSSTSAPKRSSSSSSASSSCKFSSLALQVTIQCAPTSFKISDSTTVTTTCSPLTTVTANGCSATGWTTTVFTSERVSRTQTACASDTCGDACPMNGGPLSGALMNIVAPTEDCASIPTRTSSILPTASYGVAGSAAVISPTPESTTITPSKRSLLDNTAGYERISIDHSMIKRALLDVQPPYANYVRNLNPTWISQAGDASGTFFDYPQWGQAAAGVNGIYGCTSVIVSSEKGVYISHIWEDPVFITGDWVPTDDNTFTTKAFNALRSGTATAQSISALIGTDQIPGPLNAIYSPKVFVLTPKTTEFERTQLGITTSLRYETRARQLAQQISQIVPGSGDTGSVLGYTRTSAQMSTQDPGTAGRAILEVDPFQSWLTISNPPADSPGLQIGRWRLWVEDQLITYQDFWIPHTTAPDSIQGRSIGYPNPCAKLTNNSFSSSSSSQSASHSAFKTSLKSISKSTTSPSGDLNPSSCKYTVTSIVGITTSAYTIQPTMATMCLCDSSVQAGINTVTGTSSTSYLVCAVPSKITVSTLQPTSPSPTTDRPTTTAFSCTSNP